MEQSATRLLRNIFRVGLFENPYLDPQESERIVGNSEFMQAGYDAQLKSIVMLKNKNYILLEINLCKVCQACSSTKWYELWRLPGETKNDEEGVANMKNLGQNIAWLLNRLK